MKKQKRLVFGVAVLIIAAIFMLAGCDNGNGGGGGDTSGRDFSVSGTFTHESSSYSFEMASDEAAARSISRAISADSYSISGKLTDGDITFRLTGAYDPESGAYTASASSSVLRLSINGDADTPSSGEAILALNTGGDNWEIVSVPISSGEVSITDDVTEIEGDVFPEAARGFWYVPDFGDDVSLIIGSAGIRVVDGDGMEMVKSVLIDIENNVFIHTFPDWSDMDDDNNTAEAMYEKYQFVLSNNTNTITLKPFGLDDGEGFYEISTYVLADFDTYENEIVLVPDSDYYLTGSRSR